jgi:DNA transformation protein
MNDKDLISLPNIDKILAERLFEIGIKTINDLKTTGSEVSFTRLKIIDPSACFNELCALEGAIQGVRWHDLDTDKKMN